MSPFPLTTYVVVMADPREDSVTAISHTYRINENGDLNFIYLRDPRDNTSIEKPVRAFAKGTWDEVYVRS